MRVIAGEAGGVPLAAPAGRETRPTADKLKGAIFSSLGDAGCTGLVLDLFAGSGALGIEALSRGADHCDFVEHAGAACKVIRRNLAKAKLEDRAQVHCLAVSRFLASAPDGSKAYDLVLLDPPYALPELESVLQVLGSSRFIHQGSTVLLEHATRRAVPPAIGPLPAIKTRSHGDGSFTVYGLT